MQAYKYIFLLCFCLFHIVSCNHENKSTAFVPTNEWQVVKKGTPIPRGLHVRHNLKTGVTEARLLEEESKSNDNDRESDDLESHSLTLHPDEVLHQTKNDEDSTADIEDSISSKFSFDELKARLKKIKADENEKFEEKSLPAETSEKKFRDYETLKEELKALEVNITTDSELLKEYFDKFKEHKNSVIDGTLSTSQTTSVLEILNDLEYLIHQIDNAQTFTDMKGITTIILPCLNGTNTEIIAEALKLLGAAVQSNPKVQIKALENDLIQKVLHTLSSSNKPEVKSRCLFALSALIRQFPLAQKTLLDHGGLEIFGKILIDGDIIVQSRILKLINDLIMERQDLRYTDDPNKSQMRAKQYASTNFEETLTTHNYCQHLSHLVKTFFHYYSTQADISDEFNVMYNDFIEVIGESMIITNPICRAEFSNWEDSLLPKINDVLDIYQKSNAPEYEHLITLIKKLKTTIFVSESKHDEL